MNKFLSTIVFFITALFFVNCNNKNRESSIEVIDSDTIIIDADQYIRFETSNGNFVIKLYKETPLHRHNMVKQVKKGFYDGQLFFGVEKNFKIQAGDPNSKNAKPGVVLGVNQENDTIKGEIDLFKFYHKRGAVGQASLRQINYSTSQQFYIITGTKISSSTLKRYEAKINQSFRKALKDSLTQPYAKEILEYRDKKYSNKISVLNDRLDKETDKILEGRRPFKYSEKQIEEYATIGGAASLDGYYTIFGEIIEGMEIVESISKVRVDKNSRPISDIKIIKAVLIDNPDSTTVIE
ncbi:MAG TPA: peptidylprolyl isomerase [Bacteroidaceae bacterium]|nr:peptidylprolyl isomerase [Bacteroidaceae bacterium]